MSAAVMHAWIWTGEEFRTCAELPIADRGFRYGMALFESLRVHRGRPLFLEEHLRILRDSCRLREFPVPEEAVHACRDLFERGVVDGFARVYVTAGDGSVGASVTECRTLVLLEERPWQERESCRVDLSPETHWPAFGGLKTANYWMHVDALQRAVRKGFDETLLFNEHAELVSASMATVFLVRDGQIRTPATVCGARAGVLRAWIGKREPVRECSLFLKDVMAAEEVFIANSWIGIRPVAEVDGRVLPSRAVGTRLAEAYRREVLG
jgi:branched-subunit amino acid aminotransferase/4-amino-4-deoxychorismate lyase